MNDQQTNSNSAGRAEAPENKNTDTSAVYLGESALQSKGDFEKEKKANRTEDKITTSGVDDLQSNSDGAAGTDRAGTIERKNYGDVELNKGLEEQAKDAES